MTDPPEGCDGGGIVSPFAYIKVDEFLDCIGGLDGCTVFASLAKKNFESLSALCGLLAPTMSETA